LIEVFEDGDIYVHRLADTILRITHDGNMSLQTVTNQ
jgi:hypothetical protein